MAEAFKYSVLVWLTGLVLSTVICNLLMLLQPSLINANLYFLLSIGLSELKFGALLSFGSLVLLICFTYLLSKQSIPEKNLKVILTFVGLALAVVPLLFVNRGSVDFDQTRQTLRMVIYPIVAMVSVWAYKFKPVRPQHDLKIGITSFSSLP